MMLTIEERTFLVEQVFKAGDKYSEVVKQQFQDKFPNSSLPHRDTVRDLISKFRQTGSVMDFDRSGRPTVLTEEKLTVISDKMLRSPSKSMRRLAQESDISVYTAHKAVREKLCLFPYKITAVQELKPADYEKRLHYCEWFNNFIQLNGKDVLDETFYTDEAWFHLTGYINSQNSRLWTADNPHEFSAKPLHDQKIGVWAAVSRSRVVGPIFLSVQLILKDTALKLSTHSWHNLLKMKSTMLTFNKMVLQHIRLVIPWNC